MSATPRLLNWEERCARLSAWIADNDGRVPSQMSDDAVERGLYSWLHSNRKRLKAGVLTPEQEALFKALPVHEPSRNTTSSRIAELQAFYDSHGRLPLTTASDASEKSLATFMVASLRSRLKKGTLPEDLRARARAIPGVDEFGHLPDQDQTLQELYAYADRHGHMPPFGKTAKGPEYRLSTWVRNNTRGNPEDKSLALQSRHEAILALMELYPGAAEAEQSRRPDLREQQLRDIEAYVEQHGHLPASTGRVGSPTKRAAASLAVLRQELDAGGMAKGDELRIKAVLTYPGVRDFEWQQSFDELVRYASAHDGRLPGNWGEGRVFSWLTAQRRQHRQSQLSQERQERLLTIKGALPESATGPSATAESG